MQNMWTDNSSTAYSSAEAVKQERIFMIYCCYISKGYKVNNVITFSYPCLWASSDKLHLTKTKSSTFSGLRDAPLAVTTIPAAEKFSVFSENTLSDFELAAGTGKTILTRCERSVKYTLQLSWFTVPKTRPEPDPKSKSATRQALPKSAPGWLWKRLKKAVIFSEKIHFLKKKIGKNTKK